MAEKWGFGLINPVITTGIPVRAGLHTSSSFQFSVFPHSWILKSLISCSCCRCPSMCWFLPLVSALPLFFTVLCSPNLFVLLFSPHLSCQHCSHSLSSLSLPALRLCSELFSSALTPGSHGSDPQELFGFLGSGFYPFYPQRFQPGGKNFFSSSHLSSPMAEIWNAFGSSYPWKFVGF